MDPPRVEIEVLPPERERLADGKKIDKGTRGARLRAVLEELGLAREGLGWYEATRHTFASQWVMRGGSIEKLKELLGHYSVVVTERYAHLRRICSRPPITRSSRPSGQQTASSRRPLRPTPRDIVRKTGAAL